MTLSRGTMGFAAASTVTGPIATAEGVSLIFTVSVKPPWTRTPGTSAAVKPMKRPRTVYVPRGTLLKK